MDTEGDVGTYTSIAVEGIGAGQKIHITYRDETNKALKYAYYGKIDVYTTEIKHYERGENYEGDLPQDKIIVPRAKTEDKTIWFLNTFDSGGVGKYSSLKQDSFKNLHVAYYDDAFRNLKYAKKTGEVREEVIKTHTYKYKGENDEEWSETNSEKSFEGITIAHQTIDSDGNVGEYASLALDTAGKVHIAYFDATKYNLKYISNQSGPFISSVVDSGGHTGIYTSIAVKNNKVYISYHQYMPQDSLRFAQAEK